MPDRDKFYLTDKDRKALKDAVRLTNNHPPAEPPRTPFPPTDSPYADNNATPEMYVALTGEDGISAAYPESSEVLIPGSAICSVHFLNRKTVDQVSVVEGLQYRVFNLSSNEIPARSWIPIWRDKYGTWFTQVLTVTIAPETGTGTSTSTSDTPGDDCPSYRVVCKDGYLKLERCSNGVWSYAGDLDTICGRTLPIIPSGTGATPEPEEQVPVIFPSVAKACLRLAGCVEVTDDYTIEDLDLYSIEVDASTGSVIITLPLWDDALYFSVVKIDSSGNHVTIVANGGSINGASSYVLSSQWESGEFNSLCNGSGWYVRGGSGHVGTSTA